MLAAELPELGQGMRPWFELIAAINFKGHDGVPKNWWLTIRQQAGIFKS
jgi:hypothetical protein